MYISTCVYVRMWYFKKRCDIKHRTKIKDQQIRSIILKNSVVPPAHAQRVLIILWLRDFMVTRLMPLWMILDSTRNTWMIHLTRCKWLFTWRNRIGYPAQPGLIRPSVCLSVCTYLQIRCSAENGTGPTDSVNYSSKSWIYNVNCESEILRKKYICESNTVNNMKLIFSKKSG
jgi:hypothetical protein